MNLNLGCGFRKKEGFINVDQFAHCEPDVVVDLARETWPWDDSSIENVSFDFSLEQMGETPSHLKHILTELYRVCKNDAKVSILAIHPRHDEFVMNPLCTQRLSPGFFQSLSVQANMQMIAEGRHDSSLGLMWGVDFAITHFKLLLAQEFEGALNSPEDEALLRQRLVSENNIAHGMEFELKAAKH